MKLILTAAYFVVCQNCGGHGHVVTAAGQVFPEDLSKEQASATLKSARMHGLVQEDEAKVVQSQIDASSLTEYADPLTLILSELVERGHRIEKKAVAIQPGETLH